MKEKTITKVEIENNIKQEKIEFENKKKQGLVELSDSELDSVTGGFTVWYNRDSVQFKFSTGDEVEVYDEPHIFRCTTERVRITHRVYMHYTDDNVWGPAYEGNEVDGGKFREFEEWEIEGCSK